MKPPEKSTRFLTNILQRRKGQALRNEMIRKNLLQVPQYHYQNRKRQDRKYQSMTLTSHGMTLHPGNPTQNPRQLRISRTCRFPFQHQNRRHQSPPILNLQPTSLHPQSSSPSSHRSSLPSLLPSS